MQKNTGKNISIAMLAAAAFVVMALIRIPVVLFLKYEPKDIIIAISGFIYGPLTALIITLIVSAVEMVTISTTGFIGLVMNVLSTACFACASSYIYKKHRTLKGAVIGLTAGSLIMVVMMLLWNYLITPIYMGYPREAVAKMLIPVFLPFNLVKASLNTAITLLIYKPLTTALKKAHLLESKDEKPASKNVLIIIVSFVIIISSVLIILAFNKII